MEGGLVDGRPIAFTGRVNLDMMWSRKIRTVGSYRSAFTKSVKADSRLGLTTSVPHQGFWYVGDEMGFQVALQMIVASQWKGIYPKEGQ